MAGLLAAVAAAPPPGQQPWFAASAEKQQFVVWAVARMGAKADAAVAFAARSGLLPVSAVDQVGRVEAAMAAFPAAARQLWQQPLLRQHLEAAAPALLQRGDEIDSSASASVSRLQIPRAGGGLAATPDAHLGLLAALAQQLDPLALGLLRLPGCYNPACTSRAGASEADMKLKRCTGCKIARCVGSMPLVAPARDCACAANSSRVQQPPHALADTANTTCTRYCGAECSKQHWKHHKSSCRKAAAAAAAAGGADA
jgi:hypothetical protein